MRGAATTLALLLCAGGALAGDDTASDASAFALPALPGIEVNQAFAYYRLQAVTARTLYAEMTRKAPAHPDSAATGFGHTAAQIRWSYDLAWRDDDACVPDAARVRLDLEITLPRWQPQRRPPTPLLARWRAYRAGLVAHERHHRDLAVAAAQDIHATLDTMPPGPCAMIGLRVDLATRRILERLQRRNAAFDADADHGSAHWRLP